MDEASITRYITETFDSVDCVVASGDTFFFYGTDRKYPLPFATIVTKDTDHDRASHLDRPSVFRLNIGVGKETFRSLFASQPSGPAESGVVDTGPDFAALDQLLPHPCMDGCIGSACSTPATRRSKRCGHYSPRLMNWPSGSMRNRGPGMSPDAVASRSASGSGSTGSTPTSTGTGARRGTSRNDGSIGAMSPFPSP